MNGALNLHPKVVGGGLASSLAILIIYGLSLGHIDVPPVPAAALAAVLAAFGAWLSPLIEK